MGLISIDIICASCEFRDEALVERPAPEFGEAVGLWCPECESLTMVRAVNSVTPLRASYHDGYRRGAAYDDLKRLSKLKSERANLPTTVEARRDINKEIAAVEKSAGRSYIKKEKGQ